MQQIYLYHITPSGSLLLTAKADSLDELTRQLPQGLYTTFRTYDNRQRVLGLQAHLQRLYQPAALQNISPTVTLSGLRHQMVEILQNYAGEMRIRLILSNKGEMFIILSPLVLLLPEVYKLGVKVVTTTVQRESPRLKSTVFIQNSEGIRTKIAKDDIFEGLLVRNNCILEGLTSNFFYVKDGKLGTARKNILLGVTRRTVLRVGRGVGLAILYRPLRREHVPVLNEAFLTSSSRGIVPIIQIDDEKVGEGVPGEITKKLIDAYNSYVIKHADVI